MFSERSDIFPLFFSHCFRGSFPRSPLFSSVCCQCCRHYSPDVRSLCYFCLVEHFSLRLSRGSFFVLFDISFSSFFSSTIFPTSARMLLFFAPPYAGFYFIPLFLRLLLEFLSAGLIFFFFSPLGLIFFYSFTAFRTVAPFSFLGLWSIFFGFR